jgi:hypothetical protein
LFLARTPPVNMKHIFLFLLIIGFGVLTRAQTEYEAFSDQNAKILKGIISAELISEDAAFPWYQANQVGYVPGGEAVAVLRRKATGLELMLVGGTWDENTQFLIPRFFMLTDKAGISRDHITLLGLDRRNKSIDRLPEDLHISSIPAILVFQHGLETGRILVGHKNADWESRLATLLNCSR